MLLVREYVIKAWLEMNLIYFSCDHRFMINIIVCLHVFIILTIFFSWDRPTLLDIKLNVCIFLSLFTDISLNHELKNGQINEFVNKDIILNNAAFTYYTMYLLTFIIDIIAFLSLWFTYGGMIYMVLLCFNPLGNISGKRWSFGSSPSCVYHSWYDTYGSVPLCCIKYVRGE